MAEWMIVFACAPQEPQEPGGILLLDTAANRLLVKLKTTLTSRDGLVREVWDSLAKDLEERAEESGGDQIILWLQEVASNVIQVSDRYSIDSESLGTAIDELYRKNIEAS